jgi:hypothetical protein
MAFRHDGQTLKLRKGSSKDALGQQTRAIESRGHQIHCTLTAWRIDGGGGKRETERHA